MNTAGYGSRNVKLELDSHAPDPHLEELLCLGT